MTWRLEVACSNSSWANILWCSAWDLNSESFRKLLLRQQRLPVSPTEQNSTSDETRTHNPLGHLVLSQTCIPFHHRSMILKVGLEPTYHKATDPKSAVSPIAPLEHIFVKGWNRTIDMQIFSLSLLPTELLPHKEQVTGFEPVIFGLEDRRDKPASLNLHISCHARTRTRNWRIRISRVTNYTTRQCIVHFGFEPNTWRL